MDQYNAWSLLCEYSDALKKQQLAVDEKSAKACEQRVVILADQIVEAMTRDDE